VIAVARTLAARAAVLSTVLTGVVTAVSLAVVATRVRRVQVSGESMRPALLDGDRLIVWRTRRLREGQVAALRDPRRPNRIIVKRVTAVMPPSGRRTASVIVHGDNPDASTDSRAFGPVDAHLVLGKVVYRYHPPERTGRIEARPV